MSLKHRILILIMCLFVLPLSACSLVKSGPGDALVSEAPGTDYIVVIEDEPETCDFQCTTIDYTVAINVFDRLVEMAPNAYGSISVTPSLAEYWSVSADGLTYRFHLRDGVKFSNGEALTSADVLYTFKRLLTHPDSHNSEIAELIEGADVLKSGRSHDLSGFRIINDLDFEINLTEPFQAFLPCLSMPGASIIDAASTILAGDRFGYDPEYTIGTGPYIFAEWNPGENMLFTVNPDCWSGPPKNDGIDMRFLSEAEEIRALYKNGKLDIMDLDDVGYYAEYFYRGDIYQENLFKVQRIATTYIALNENIKPLNDVNVRRAMQLALNRPLILDAVYSGRGLVVDGIYPNGLIGYDPDIPQIPYDVEEAKKLMAKAGYPDGFDLTVTMNATATEYDMNVMRIAAYMWEKLGIKTKITVLPTSEFLKQRGSGKLACYIATWTADYDDPYNFINTFFGTEENTRYRSINYYNTDVMDRIQKVKAVPNRNERFAEYQALERTVVQDDAAWIPLYSREHAYIKSDRVESMAAAWNGSVKTLYREVSLKKTAGEEAAK